MEILRNSLKETDLDTFTPFQLKVWNILTPLLNNLNFSKLSEDSKIEMGGIGLDVFLRLKANYFVLYMSIQNDNLVINSEHFDIYVYRETEADKIELLIEQLLRGKYFIKLGYGNKEKINYKELVFDIRGLKEFNENNKIGFLTKKVKYTKRLDGVRLTND